MPGNERIDNSLLLRKASARLPHGGGRLEPVDKKQLGKELSIAPGATKDAQDGDLIAVSVVRSGRLGLPAAQVEEKLGSLKSERAVRSPHALVRFLCVTDLIALMHHVLLVPVRDVSV